MLNRLRKYFLSGLIVFLPLALTVYIIYFTISFAENYLAKQLFGTFLKSILPEGAYFWGLGIIVFVLIILSIGFFVTNFLGRKIYTFFENLLHRLPLIRKVYPAIKEIATFLFADDRIKQFKQVILVEYPRKGVWAFAFLTNDSSMRICNKTGREMCNIFLPSAPGPLTGFVMLVPREDVIFTDITIEEAFKFILSGGVVNPL